MTKQVHYKYIDGGSTATRGPGVQSADVQLSNSAGLPVGNVEVKAVDGFRGFQDSLSRSTQSSSAGNMQVGAGDTIAFQVPDGTNVTNYLSRYWGVQGRTSSPGDLDRLRSTYVVVYDQQGRVLLPRQPIYNPPEKP
jgi:hypothetical protein